MTDDRKSGFALIAGSFGMVVTMAIHPTGAASPTADQVAHLAITSAIAHSLAIVSLVALFLGASGLTRRIATADRIAFAAMVTFGFGCVAVFIAAAASGFIVPEIMRHMLRDVPAAGQQWKMIIYGIFQINQAFARVSVVAVSVAIILWSVSALRNGGLGRGVATYGCMVGPLIVLGIVIGHLRVDVHGMAAIAVTQTIWFVIAGVQLCSRRGDAPSSAALSSR